VPQAEQLERDTIRKEYDQSRREADALKVTFWLRAKVKPTQCHAETGAVSSPYQANRTASRNQLGIRYGGEACSGQVFTPLMDGMSGGGSVDGDCCKQVKR
jgi:hypothetical protein